MSPEEKRQHQRKLLHADAHIADLMGRTWLPIYLLDISEAGIAFVTDEEVAIDDIRTIEFTLPEQTDCIRCDIKIANMLFNRNDPESPAGKYRIGAAFDQIDAADVASIAQFILE